MKKSKLAVNPRRIAGKRLRKKFNGFPSDTSDGRHLAVMRVGNPEAARIALAESRDTTVEGWFQFNDELMALYAHGDAMVLFDRYVNEVGSLVTVVCVAAASRGDIEAVQRVLEPSDSADWDESLLVEFGDD